MRHADLGHDHIPLPEFPHAPYNSNPPSSGAHTAYTAPWGVHARPVPPEVWLHNLEHGGVVIGYRCDRCDDLVDQLKDLAHGYALIVIAPDPALENRVALAAWGHTLAFDVLTGANRQAARDFIATHHGVDHHPPGAHPHGAPPPEAEGPDHSGH
ncbi:MAG: DUF3105 domain-containing protein [Nitrospirae bacterium]|nr:DUF3105 domain-containing protein [Nitrospirota bacterium]